MVAAAAVSAVGAISSAQATSAAAKTNARIADRNALISRQSAAAEEEKQRRLSRRQAGANRAAIGASGITMDGSALDVMEDNAMDAEMDALTIRYNGEIGAMNSESDASLERMRAGAARTAGMFGAGSALLQGGAKAYGMS
jgi:hypothetical protein